MRFPKMRAAEQTREFIQEFGGLDRRVRIEENAFAEMHNMSSDFYPALSPRRARGIVRRDMLDCSALVVCGKPAYIKGNTLYWGEGEDAVTMELRADVTEGRRLVTMGAYLVVFPDKMYLNTANAEDKGVFHVTREGSDFVDAMITLYCNNTDLSSVSAQRVFTGVEVYGRWGTEERTYRVFLAPQSYVFDSADLCLIGVPNIELGCFADYKVTSEGVELIRKDTEPYMYISDAEASGTVTVTNTVTDMTVTHRVTNYRSGGMVSVSIPSLESGYWLTKSGFYHISALSTQTKLDTRLRIDAPCFANMPDGEITNLSLTVSDTEYAPISVKEIIAEIKGGALWLDNAFLVGTPKYELGADAVCKCSFDAVVPKMDYIIEAKNRLWGCRHGQDANGNTVNEIYASALGDFREWYLFRHISTDSFSTAVGHVGDFTGAVNYRGYPLFFKENVMYKVYGDYPANFQIISDESMGVQAGCDKSLCVLTGLLYYRSPDGFFVYDGSSTARIDAALGKERFENVVCGGMGTKLWVSMRGENEPHTGLYVYDTEKGMWHMEDRTEVRFFAPYERDLYFLDTKGQLCTVRGSAGALEATPIAFDAETGIIGYSTPDSKYVSRLALRVFVPHEGHLNIFIEYNSSGVWEFKGSIEGNGMQSFTVPVVPQMCDHFRIRFAGEGDCRIFGFSKVLEEGGAV